MKIALFAFEAFGPWEENSTGTVTAAVEERLRADGVEVARRVLPVVLDEAPGLVRRLLDAEQPDAVVATGLAGRCHRIHIERVAVNVADFSIPDNSGAQVRGLSLDPEGPDAWLIQPDPHHLVERVAVAGSEAAVSNSAGTYLCNAVHYAQLSWTRPRGVPGVFLHLPPLPGMAAEGAARCARQVDPEAEMDLEMQVRGVLAIARDLLGLEPPL